jgi:hypothetical protein
MSWSALRDLYINNLVTLRDIYINNLVTLRDTNTKSITLSDVMKQVRSVTILLI